MKTSTFNYKRLKEGREEIGWSQEQLVAELYSNGLHLSRQTWVNYENGKTEPDVSDMLRIATVLKKPFEFFLTA